MPAQQIDTHIAIVTPENIAFQYRVAGPFQRLPAYLIDLLIRGVIVVVGFFAIMLIFGTIGLEELAFGFWMIVMFAFEWFYGGIFETVWNGQTPGKWLLGLRVVSTTGQPIVASQAVLRNLLRSADMMPAFYDFGPTFQLGLVVTAANSRFQRLGDFASGTMVIVEEPQRKHGVVAITEPEVTRLAATLPPRIHLSPTTARALSSYVARRTGLSPARRIEISRHLAEPLRQRLGLPPSNPDLLLCALYQRTFLADMPEADAVELAAANRPVEKTRMPVMAGEPVA